MPLLLALIKQVSRPWWIVVLVAALAGGAGYWRGAQQTRLVAQATLATRQADCVKNDNASRRRSHNRRWKPP